MTKMTDELKDQIKAAADLGEVMEKFLSDGKLGGARELEGKLAEILREEMCKGDAGMTVAEINIALSMLMARASLAIAGIALECNHEDCAKQIAVSVHMASSAFTQRAIQGAIKLNGSIH
jgi:hypothetical protein